MISVCVLSFNRPEFLAASIETLLASAAHGGVELELIVGDDGSEDSSVRSYLVSQLESGAISGLVLAPPGHNEGVGRMVNRLWAMANGDVICKADQDLLYAPEALAEIERVANLVYGTVGGFRYWADPVRHDQMLVSEGPDFDVVRDYVSSFLAVRRKVADEVGAWPEHSDAYAEDIEWKARVAANGGCHVLTKQDVIQNVGFGVGPSTVVVAEGQVRPIHHGPRTVA